MQDTNSDKKACFFYGDCVRTDKHTFQECERVPLHERTEATFCVGRHVYESVDGPLLSCSEGRCAARPAETTLEAMPPPDSIYRSRFTQDVLSELEEWDDDVHFNSGFRQGAKWALKFYSGVEVIPDAK